MSVPFTLRSKITHNPEERRGLGKLYFVFVGDMYVHTAQFLGGFENKHLVSSSEQDKQVHLITETELDRPIYCLTMSLERSASGCLAAFLIERLSTHMKRLRLSGDDPFMVFDKAWKEVWDWLGEFQKKNNFSDVLVGVALDEALQQIIDCHPYGPALARLREWRRVKYQAMLVGSEV